MPTTRFILCCRKFFLLGENNTYYIRLNATGFEITRKLKKGLTKISSLDIMYDNSLMYFVCALIILYVVGVMLYFLTGTFRENGRYIKGEIKRSVGERKLYWKKELKKHYVSHIPIVGKYLEKRM